MSEQTLSVTQLNNFIKDILESEVMLSNVYVCGELSNYKMYPSGHHYFTLKDSESSIRCVMFRRSAARLRFRPENGMRVIVSGRISVFPRDGAEVVPPAVKINMEKVKVSSSEIREKIKLGKDCRNLLPKPVFDYIIKNSLYK